MRKALKLLLKFFKIIGITIGSILLLLFLLPYMFPGTVEAKIKKWVNNSITTELNFSKARLSFFNHFPALTLSLHDFSLMGSAPFQKDTLVKANEIAFGIDLSSLFDESIRIDQVFLTEGNIKVQVNEQGQPNYNVYRSKPSKQKRETKTDTGSASLHIEKIQVENCKLEYNDRTLPLLVQVDDFDYTGKGDLSNAVFDLYTQTELGGVDVVYDGRSYLKDKMLKGDLVTKINTNSLALIFPRNDIMINDFPVQLTGNLVFLSNGYEMDLQLISKQTAFRDIFTALPPQFTSWVEKKQVNGKVETIALVKGVYNVSENKMPDVNLRLKVRNGSIASAKNIPPIENLLLNVDVHFPQLNTDSLQLKIDSLQCSLGNDFINGRLLLEGLSSPFIDADINANLDLQKWSHAMGLDSLFLVRGKYTLALKTRGVFAKGQNPASIRPDTIVTSIPSFSIRSDLRNGYFKYGALKQAINSIAFKLDADCDDNNYHHTKISLDDLKIEALQNFIKGYVHVKGEKGWPVDANLSALVKLDQLSSFYPLDSIDLKGNLQLNLQAKGVVDAEAKKFPVTKANLVLKDASVQTKYYPHPVEQINGNIQINSTKGSLQDIDLVVNPCGFVFEGKPFQLTASLKNFDNLLYDIKAKGDINIGRIYQVFAVDGYNVDGTIEADCRLQGSQAAISSGRYDQLHNSGTFLLKQIDIKSELYPKPFTISSGLFRFSQDKIQFERVSVNYGSTNAMVSGYCNNIVNYALKDDVLKGGISLSSKHIFVDELMAYSSSSDAAGSDTTSADGVLLLPVNLDMLFTVDADKINYDGLDLTKGRGKMLLQKGRLTLNETGFNIIGAPVTMEASYVGISPVKANFDFHIRANSFDIKRAYKEVKLFREMATAAEKAAGIVSLDYNLKGALDQNMYPVFPSLKGGGVLALQKIKVNGLKLFSAIGRATGRDSLNNPDLSKVEIKTKIDKNIMTIERVKLKVAGFRPRLEGQVDFDGRLNLKGRLGLPPFGIIGIPFTVTGTQENPKVKLRRGKETDQLEEKDYDEESPEVRESGSPKQSLR